VHLEDLTWPELTQRIAAGAATAIVPTVDRAERPAYGSGENTNFVVREAAGRIARELGLPSSRLCSRSWPEGPLERPSGNLQFAGTLALSEDSFERVLRDIALSLARSGFKLICFIGDHGQSQAAQTRVAERLSGECDPPAYAWSTSPPTIRQTGGARTDPLRPGKEALGDHGGIADTAQLMAVKPEALRREFFV